MFILTIIRYLRGYIEIAVSGGFYDRFLNLAAKENISMWGIFRKDGVLYIKTYARQYKYLRHVAKHSGMKMTILERRGLPFFLHRYRKRKGLAIGIAGFFLLLYLMSLFIWTVEVHGNEETSTQEILDVLSELGLKPCVLRGGLDIHYIENSAAIKLPSLVWLAVNMQGSCIVVEVKERVMPPEMVPIDKPCNIVAAHAGQIISIEAYEGQAMVKVGDAVAKGDLLISGIVEDGKGLVTPRHARGVVLAQTKRVVSTTVPFKQEKKELTDEVITRRKVEFFGFEIPLYIGKEPEGDYHVKNSRMRTNIHGFKPPIGYATQKWTKLNVVEFQVTKEEAVILAREQLEEKLKQEVGEVDIIDKQEEIKIDSHGVTVIHTYICREDIALKQEIYINSDDK